MTCAKVRGLWPPDPDAAGGPGAGPDASRFGCPATQARVRSGAVVPSCTADPARIWTQLLVPTRVLTRTRVRGVGRLMVESDPDPGILAIPRCPTRLAALEGPLNAS